MDNNINNKDDIDNLTALSEDEIASPNNNKDVEIMNNSVVELEDAPIQIVDIENPENENIECEEEIINDINAQSENSEEECGDDTNIQ